MEKYVKTRFMMNESLIRAGSPIEFHCLYALKVHSHSARDSSSKKGQPVQ